MIVYDMKIIAWLLDLQYDLEGKGQGKIYLKSVLWLVTQNRLSIFDGGCSSLAQ